MTLFLPIYREPKSLVDQLIALNDPIAKGDPMEGILIVHYLGGPTGLLLSEEFQLKINSFTSIISPPLT